jgi:serine/threonine protein kinase
MESARHPARSHRRIKRLKAEHSERFKREARAIAALNHPHICQLYDVGVDYLVMEYVEGTPLRCPLPAEEAIRLAIQIALALEEAHSKGVIYRDLKPGNILITPKGETKTDHLAMHKGSALQKIARNRSWSICHTNRAVASDVRQQVEILIVFVLAAFSFAKHLFRLDELDTLDPFDHLVAKLILHSQPQRCSK